MMIYEARERWIRDRIVMKNRETMKAGQYTNYITTSVVPEQEKVQLGNNWEIELYEGGNNVWFLEIFEKSTEREFTIYITM